MSPSVRIALVCALCGCSGPRSSGFDRHPARPASAPARVFRRAEPRPQPIAARPEAPAEPEPAAEPEQVPLPRGTTVLHVGDSFADALGGALRVELEREGIHAINKAKTGSYIPEWAGLRSDVPALVRTHNPDLVIITLGGNELKVPDPASRAEPIRRLVRFVGDRPCVWVAPSLWKSSQNALITETGLLQVIRDNAKPCRFFDTNAIVPNLERTGDHVHPSIPARRVWARAFVQWLEHEIDPAAARPWQLRPER